MQTPLPDTQFLTDILIEADAATHALSGLLDEETHLLRNGALKEALALAPQKANLSLVHNRAAQRIRTHAVALHRSMRTEALAYRERERALLQKAETNIRVIGILRTALDHVVRQALQEQDHATSPYSKSGRLTQSEPTGHRLLSRRS